jgi:2,5-diketo-D-gluconate reductase A
MITARVVADAIKAGYRLIDTAEGYNNEDGVGRAIHEAGVPRSDLFITSKLHNGAHARDLALKNFDETMKKLGIEQIDLFLIHWPVPSRGKYVEAWRTLVELQKQGRIKSIGVSNFNQDHLERIVGETDVTPVVNQIELHPSFQQRDKRDFHKQHDIKIESWSPLGSGRALGDPKLGEIARKHNKSAAQVIIRWHLQEGLIVIPKSTHKERLEENLSVLDFELDAGDLEMIAALDNRRGRTGSDPATAS